MNTVTHFVTRKVFNQFGNTLVESVVYTVWQSLVRETVCNHDQFGIDVQKTCLTRKWFFKRHWTDPTLSRFCYCSGLTYSVWMGIFHSGWGCAAVNLAKHERFPGLKWLKAGPPPPWGYFCHLWSKTLHFFFVWKVLEKNEKWRQLCAHAQWWSPWRRKNVEKGHLALSNLTFLLIAIDRNGFPRLKEEGLIYKKLPQIFA